MFTVGWTSLRRVGCEEHTANSNEVASIYFMLYRRAIPLRLSELIADDGVENSKQQ
jgi:hypothetical protein